ISRNTVPPGRVVPTFLVEASESPELSAGIVSVVQTTQAEAPGRFDTMFFETSSIFTTARPLPSCPVTTRRTFTLMRFSLSAFHHYCRADYTREAGSRGFAVGAPRALSLLGSVTGTFP